MAVYDSVGNYILFETGSNQSTRTWWRSENSGRDTTGPRVLEKLKYTILKNPPNTVRLLRQNYLTSEYTVKVGTRLYAIDPVIYSELIASLALVPVYTLAQLQTRIAEIRVLTNTSAPLSVQLAEVPLSQYRKRYTYLTSESPQTQTTKKTHYDFIYKVGNLISSAYLDTVIQPYKDMYPTAYFATPQFLYVTPNEGIFGNTKIQGLYPGASADIFGTPLLAIANLVASRTGAIIPYTPIFAYFSPASDRANGGMYTAKTGLVLGFDSRFPLNPINAEFRDLLTLNSELIFVPIQTRLEQVTYVDYPPNSAINLKVTNGGKTDQSTFNAAVQKINIGMTNSKSVALTIPTFTF